MQLMRLPLCVLLSSFFIHFPVQAIDTQVSQKEYFVWIDANGITHFSDTPPPKEKQFDVRQLPSMKNEEAFDMIEPMDLQADAALDDNFELIATKIEILSPENQATIRNNSGDVIISTKTDHPLKKNQTIRAVIDGAAKLSQRESEISLENVYRGEHQISVQLLTQGKVTATSKPMTIYMHRAIVKPAPPKTD